MITAMTRRRIQKERETLEKDPIEGVRMRHAESNMLEWHYVLQGSKDTPFEGGVYHGMLILPSDYPFQPPALKMCTPNGRFAPNQRICMSITDYHPETWNPGWQLQSIVLATHSFMNSNEYTTGCVRTTDGEKKKLAAASIQNTLANQDFCAIFPEMADDLRAGRQPDFSGGNKAATKPIQIDLVPAADRSKVGSKRAQPVEVVDVEEEHATGPKRGRPDAIGAPQAPIEVVDLE